VRDITSDENDAMVVEAIISMAAHLNLSVIAEGVEDQQQLDFLVDKGCHAFQGYYFSRPLTADDFECYIREQG
ncbi:MAG: EAL domain-containing protein, partial [Gammaproteobacteria bacterium]|nr:EAL domain-containing protein [Gammaproteobacteria bacterium]